MIVTNNTVTGNSLGGIVVEHTAARITIVNNIAAFNQGAGIRGYFSAEDHPDDPAGTGNIVHDNLVFGNGGYGNLYSDAITVGTVGGRDDSPIRPSTSSPILGSSRPARRNFRLRRGSPALGRAVPRYTPLRRSGRLVRRKRSSLDLGAYERR